MFVFTVLSSSPPRRSLTTADAQYWSVQLPCGLLGQSLHSGSGISNLVRFLRESIANTFAHIRIIHPGCAVVPLFCASICDPLLATRARKKNLPTRRCTPAPPHNTIHVQMCHRGSLLKCNPLRHMHKKTREDARCSAIFANRIGLRAVNEGGRTQATWKLHAPLCGHCIALAPRREHITVRTVACFPMRLSLWAHIDISMHSSATKTYK